MKTCEDSHILFYVHLLTMGMLAGVFCGKTKKYKQLKTDYNILQRENVYLKKSRKAILQQQRRFRSIRHDMKSDYILEIEYLENEMYQPLMEHYQKKADFFRNENRLVHTGSIGMDAILNHMQEAALKECIHIDIQHQLLTHVKIDDRDLNIILGNLLDNAMEAVRKLKAEDRKIILQVSTDATALFLEISNKYVGKLQKDSSGNYLTQKTDRVLHGLGLLKVKSIAHKYGGGVVTNDENNIFNVKVLLYMRN